MTKQFEYNRSEKLIAAQRRLGELRQLSQQAGPLVDGLREDYRAAYNHFLETETAYALAEADKKELEKARAAATAAKVAVEQAEQGNPPNRYAQEITRLSLLVEELAEEEKQVNLSEFKPLYQAAIDDLDAALQTAIEASDKLTKLQMQNSNLAAYWPGGFPKLAHQYKFWRERRAKYSL
jgi:uncharacterized membrane-anchored protein YhcB (DUF1043 family)